jgi:hypothetical protein
MTLTHSLNLIKNNTRTILLDTLLLMAILLTPTFTHLFNLPLYVVEPMRLALFASILFTNRANSILIAAALPLFSLVTSGHPVIVKSFLISIELVVNVMLFYLLYERTKSNFFSALISITASKILYYIIKYLVITMGLLSSALVSTSLLVQGVVLIATATIFYMVSLATKRS